ncbi:MAG: MerR family transcriptional regulator [Clostridiales bacterium]|nr:MerR family transcriptional regulator [Clostridiales bacterium]
MTKYKAIPQGYMTVGEVAKKMGITVRALQYYDREGLFRPSCISEGGRRLYNDEDIIKLHQFLTLKSLGFSFDEIKNRLISIDTPQKAIDALTEQGNAVQAQIDTLARSLQSIELLKNEIEQMQAVDFSKYADIIVNLQMGNKYYGLIKYFDDNMLDHCHKKFDRATGADFINRFNAIISVAEKHIENGVSPNSEQGQTIAKEFWQLITEFTDGDMSMLPQLMNLGKTQASDGGFNNIQSTLKGFIEPALGAYFNNSGIDPFEGNNG